MCFLNIYFTSATEAAERCSGKWVSWKLRRRMNNFFYHIRLLASNFTYKWTSLKVFFKDFFFSRTPVFSSTFSQKISHGFFPFKNWQLWTTFNNSFSAERDYEWQILLCQILFAFRQNMFYQNRQRLISLINLHLLTEN